MQTGYGMDFRTLALAPAIALASLAACGSDDPAAPATPGQEVRSAIPRDTAPDVPAEDQAALVAGATDFAVRLHHQVAAEPGNLVYSPLSMSTALSMLYVGARGNTETQMAAALGFTLPQDRLHPAQNWLDLELSSRSEVDTSATGGHPFKLSIVNKLWAQDGFELVPAFLDTLAASYDAGVQLLDFAASPESARLAINAWVAEKTEERIKDLLVPGTISPLTRVVLTNAVYFFASWSVPFEESHTVDGTFHPLEGLPVTVPMMNKWDEEATYAKGDGYELVQMDYLGHQVAMTLLVPDPGHFEDVEAGLTGASLQAMFDELHSASVHIGMPRFQIDLALDLVPVLSALGMTDAFADGRADFSGIDGTTDLVVTAVAHKAFIKVDEKGTEATAATAIVAGPTASPEPVSITIDRPFLFFLRDRVTGAILFVGRVTNPAP